MPALSPPVSTVLVTGGAGVMGRRLIARLLAAGWRVRALVLPSDRGRAALERMGCEVHEGDVAERASLAGICDGVDTVYHLAAVILSHDPSAFERINLQGTRNVVALAAAAGVRHLIYVSSASVTYPQLTAYGRSKLAAEACVTETSAFASTIVRPTLVYERQGGLELRAFYAYLRRFPLVPLIGEGHAVKRPVHADDVVDGLFAMAGRPIAHGKCYNLSGAEPIRIRELAQLLLRLGRASRPLVPLPVALCGVIADGLARVMLAPPLTRSAIAGMIYDADLSSDLAMRELGYRPSGVHARLHEFFAVDEAPRAIPETTRTRGEAAECSAH